MVAAILDGKLIATQQKLQIRKKILERLQQGYPAPELAVILVGNDPASAIYVSNKRKACEETGIKSHAYNLTENTTEDELLDLINQLNAAANIHGILVQLPLPANIDVNKIIESIHPNKDVDGFHPYSIGRLAQGNPLLRPCTPLGIMKLLEHYQLDVQGKHAVVIGASNIVGRPMALELINANATVTICRRSTVNLEQHVRMADILIVATGVYNIINPEWLNSNQILIDIGIHRGVDGKVHGDMDFNQAKNKVAWITPVPGGAGPMTICMLLQNTLSAASYLSR